MRRAPAPSHGYRPNPRTPGVDTTTAATVPTTMAVLLPMLLPAPLLLCLRAARILPLPPLAVTATVTLPAPPGPASSGPR